MSLLDDISTGGAGVEIRLAELRRARGIAAADLARRVGVSRQTIYAMEAGDYVPNTAVALKLARILETTVEDLFRLEPGEPDAPPVARATLIGGSERFPGTPLELCRVDGRLVAVPAVPAPWRLLPADGILVDPARSTVQILHREDAAPHLLIAGCDPATSLLARHLQRSGVSLVSAPVNSSVALQLLKRRMVHIAGTHLSGTRLARPAAKKLWAVFNFAVWEQGLVLARGNPKGVRKINDLARRGIRFANREPGSGSRSLLDARLEAAGIASRSVSGYDDPPADGHLAAAWRVYSKMADCCVATRSAARAFGLDFVPLSSERYDFVIRRDHLASAPVARLLDTLTQSGFRRELESLCSYDTRATGSTVPDATC
jgi:putative molybdopterin biosynthesis protein